MSFQVSEERLPELDGDEVLHSHPLARHVWEHEPPVVPVPPPDELPKMVPVPATTEIRGERIQQILNQTKRRQVKKLKNQCWGNGTHRRISRW